MGIKPDLNAQSMEYKGIFHQNMAIYHWFIMGLMGVFQEL